MLNSKRTYTKEFKKNAIKKANEYKYYSIIKLLQSKGLACNLNRVTLR